jgi:hypothetical protein
MAPQVQDALAAIEDAAHAITFLAANPGPASGFLADALARRWERAALGLMRGFAADPERHAAIREGLLARDDGRRDAAVQALGSLVAAAIGARLAEARRQAE